MGEFYAWTLTGEVTVLETWADVDDQAAYYGQGDEGGSAQIATRLSEQQRFTLRVVDGSKVSVHLSDSGVALQDGHRVTLVWAASRGSSVGHCVYIENHTTGASARLEKNTRLIRSPVEQKTVLGFGLLATVPAILAVLAWLSSPSALFQIDATTLLGIAAVVIVLVFCVGAVVSKLVFEYLRSEDEDKLWKAANQALAAARQPQTLKPQSLRQRLAQRR